MPEKNININDGDDYELAGRFSYITNALNYCGPSEGSKLFYKYITGEDRSAELAEKIRESFKKFEALYPYLKFISEKHGKDFLDHDVVEAYWIGNSLLDKFNEKDMCELVERLVQRGLPKNLGDELIINMPKGAFPHHAFHVMYVGVGNVTGHVKTTIQNMDNCRPSAGRILHIVDDKLIVETDQLETKDGLLSLVPDEKTVVYDRKMLPDIKLGDHVAIHWGFAGKKLNNEQVHNLKKYTIRAIQSRNLIPNHFV